MIMTFKDFCRERNSYNVPLNEFGDPYYHVEITDDYIRECVIPDQSPSEEVFLNECGFYANDIQKLLQAERDGNHVLSQYLQSKFANVGDDSYLPSDMSESDMFNSTPSRYAQDPVEIVRDAERIASSVDVPKFEEMQNAAKSDDSGTIKFDDNTSNTDGL